MRRSAVLTLALLLGCGHSPVVEPPADPLSRLDWPDFELQHRALLTRLLRTDTAGPVANEAPAARVLQSFLRRGGVESELVDEGGGHLSLVARLPSQTGGRRARQLILLSHLDTAPVDPIAWSRDVPPLALTAREGRLHGLGLLGGKGLAALHAAALVALAESGVEREAEIVMIAAAEGRRMHAPGLVAVLKRFPKLGAAELALAGGGPRVFNLLGAEKVTQLLSVADRGLARVEIASVAPTEGPVGPVVRRMAEALIEAEDAREAPRLSPPARAFIDALAGYQGFLDRWLMQSERLSPDLFVPEFAARPLVGEQFKGALLTQALQGSLLGAIRGPRRARALVNALFLPGDSPGAVVQRMRRRVDDPSVHIAIVDAELSSSSPVADPGYQALRAAAEEPGLQLLPFLHGSPSGALPLRELGVPTYGYAPWELSVEAVLRADSRRGRMDEAELGRALRRMTRTLQRLTGAR